MTRDEIAAHNREHAPNVVEMVAPWMKALREAGFRPRLVHAVDNVTQMELGTVGDVVKPEHMIARRCDEHR